jgi:hypothetical protein
LPLARAVQAHAFGRGGAVVGVAVGGFVAISVTRYQTTIKPDGVRCGVRRQDGLSCGLQVGIDRDRLVPQRRKVGQFANLSFTRKGVL